jgi:hypothetical protein
MAANQRRYSREEFARRGDALVESRVRPHLTPADEDKFIAIDIGGNRRQSSCGLRRTRRP